MITQKRLKELLKYEQDSGNFVWLVDKGTAKAGKIAGCRNLVSGYIVIKIDKKLHLAHRLIFLYVEGRLPTNQVDHINRVRNDNRWINLRYATPVENMRNSEMPKNNTSGITGVRWATDRNKWIPRIKINYKLLHLGTFDNLFDASCAR